MSLQPKEGVVVVHASGSQSLSPAEVTTEAVGEKARGLACLPTPWTLPFLVVSADLLDHYRKCAPAQIDDLIEGWAAEILPALARIGISGDCPILVRSSGTSESLQQRGRYHSTSGSVRQLGDPLRLCLQKLAADEDLNRSRVHLIVQRKVQPDSGKGHLSNERHCYEEARDWLGQFEGPDISEVESFTINLRNWRSRPKTDAPPEPLVCNLRPLVHAALHPAAFWGYQQGARLHFEWVWDGARIYIVQVDEASVDTGVDPTKDPDLRKREPVAGPFQVLTRFTEDHARRYHKIRNVLAYLKLGLPITSLFVLDDPAVHEAVLKDRPAEGLIKDLDILTKGSLVIRTDLATEDLAKRQLLPRTNEVRNTEQAIAFIRSTLEDLRKGGVQDAVAFIFHNFIPALASAFAYAAPGRRKVWIESLWGLPEGLYYNAHDKIEVDTQSADIAKSSERVSKFGIHKRARFKRYFVAPDESGNWVIKTAKAPWDWRLSITSDEWIREIALASRRIAEQDGTAVSIMWFIGVPDWASESPVFPWYHEPFDLKLVERPQTARRKTPFDESHVVRTTEDVESLRSAASTGTSRIRQIRIQPSEEPLLRDKNLLRKIGELAIKLDAVILLEGGTLSHAYYQLSQTKAVVEVLHGFEGSDDKREFNKLVRDSIPTQIAKGGETVSVTRLSGDLLLRALREKLVEESFEALDAGSQPSIVEELADVEEVVDAILREIRVSRKDLVARQKAKRSKSGGFQEGFILLETENPPPTRESVDDASLRLELSGGGATDEGIIERSGPAPAPTVLARWVDKRQHPSATEQILKIAIAMVREKWSAESTEISLSGSDDEVIRARIEGTREGAKLHLEISVYIPPKQMKLIS